MSNNKIRALKGRLHKGEDPINLLENYLEGRSVLVISAGPSAARWRDVYEQEKHKNPIVVCVKDTLKEVEDICDIHFLNSANLVRYKTYDSVLSIMTDNGPHTPIFGKYDVRFKVLYELIGNVNYSLASSNNYECFTLSNTGIYRPFGPGIMYESVLYTLVHLGVNEIVCIGWDIADEKGGNTHFYDDSNIAIDDDYLKQRVSVQNIKHNLSKLGLLKAAYMIRGAIKTLYCGIKYYGGYKINQASMMPGEAELVSKSLPSLKTWLHSCGVTIKIISNSKWMLSQKE